MDDAGDGSEQPQQRRHRRDRAEGIEEAFQIVNHVAAAILQALHHDFPRFVAVGQSDGQQLAERRVLFQCNHQFVAHLVRFDPIPDFLRQVTRDDAIAL